MQLMTLQEVGGTPVAARLRDFCSCIQALSVAEKSAGDLKIQENR